MSDMETLFPELPPDPPSADVEKLSADRRRTLRQREDVANGIHPLTKTKLSDDPEAKCGNCVHRINVDYGGWPKCDLTSMSRSAASDCRAWWPGCTSHERRAS